MTTSTSIAYYTTNGSARGNCGHKHRTMEGAERCLCADRRGCATQGGYSDRSLYAVSTDGQWTRYLTYFDGGRVCLGESEPDERA